MIALRQYERHSKHQSDLAPAKKKTFEILDIVLE